MDVETAGFTAFDGERCVAQGAKRDVALKLKRDGRTENVLIFDDATGRQVDFDLAGSEAEMLARLDLPAATPPARMASPVRGPGRPKLGVVAREVTLLPRHWDWLAGQPGGASAALRRLVDAARAANGDRDRARMAAAAADRFMLAMLGDKPGYEEAARALYAGDGAAFGKRIAEWPGDLRAYVQRLAEPAFAR